MKHLLFVAMLLAAGFTVSAQDTEGLAQPKELANFDYQKPLFKLPEQPDKRLRYSLLTGYQEGVEPLRGSFNANFKAFIDKEKGTHRISMYNLSIQEMFTHGLWPVANVILEVKDPSIYRYVPAYGDEKAWLRKNGWCYELMMPVGVIKGIRIVEEELESFFKVKCSREKRTIEGEQKDVLVIREL